MCENEMKLFILMRSDMPIKASDLVPALGEAFKKHMQISFDNPLWKDRIDFYFHVQPSYPKICKRFKQKHIHKMQKEISSLNIPYVEIKKDDQCYGYIIGPAYRNELPKAVDDLQLMNECEVVIDNSNHMGDVDIGYRNDIDIPAGKLIPQFGHAIQKYLCEHSNHDIVFSLHGKSLQTLLKEGNYITDVGRTFFSQPTVTTNYNKEI